MKNNTTTIKLIRTEDEWQLHVTMVDSFSTVTDITKFSDAELSELKRLLFPVVQALIEKYENAIKSLQQVARKMSFAEADVSTQIGVYLKVIADLKGLL